MVAVAIAQFIASALSTYMQRDPNATPRFRAFAFQAFVLVGILPVLLLSATNGELSATRQETEGGLVGFHRGGGGHTTGPSRAAQTAT